MQEPVRRRLRLLGMRERAGDEAQAVVLHAPMPEKLMAELVVGGSLLALVECSAEVLIPRHA